MQPTLAKPIPSAETNYEELTGAEGLGGSTFQRAGLHVPIDSLSYSHSTSLQGNFDFSGNLKGYCALLNHNFEYIYPTLSSSKQGDSGEIESWHSVAKNGVLNFSEIFTSSYGGGYYIGDKVGSTILSFDEPFPTPYSDNLQVRVMNRSDSTSDGLLLGAFSAGIQYTMPKTPDLDVQMEIVYDGIDTITTSGGKSLSNIRYKGAPHWVNKYKDHLGEVQTYHSLPFDHVDLNPESAFMADIHYSGVSRNGRRTWALKFSYMNDYDLFSSNIGQGRRATNTDYLTTLEAGDIDEDSGNWDYRYNIDTDDSFYAQVWNKTLGGALPFIFQPDSKNGNEFYICKFDQDSLSAKQSAYKVYDISLNITEVW